MGRWHWWPRWGSEGRPHAFPSLPNRRQNAFFPALGIPLFPLLFFPSLSLPFPQAGSQVEILNGGKKGGAGKEDQPCPLPERSSRAPGLSRRWAQKEESRSLPPSLAPGSPAVLGAGVWLLATRLRSGLSPVCQLWNFLFCSCSGPGKLGPTAPTHRRLICSRKSV